MEKKKQSRLKKATLKFTVAFPPGDLSVGATACYKTHVAVLEDDDVGDTASSRPHHVPVMINLPAQPTSPRPQDLDDLCRSLQQAKDKGHYLVLFLSQRGCLCYAHTLQKPSIAMRAANSTDVISLGRILQEPVSWTLNQRMAISFRVASSILQLNSTPWLGLALMSENLCFTRNTSPSDNPEPFIRKRFSKDPQNGVKERESPKRCMLELGIILLELWYAKSFKTYAAETGVSISDSFGDRYDTAAKWVDFSTFHILPCYLDVIKRCVECTFATSDPVPDWNDVVFRKSVCKLALKPLWENCPAELRSE